MACREHDRVSIGEASGTLVAFALSQRQPPRGVRADAGLLADTQRTLELVGVLPSPGLLRSVCVDADPPGRL
jgi:hypothetical protein